MSSTKSFLLRSSSSSVFTGVAAFALSASLFACVIEDSPPRRLASDPAPPVAGSSGTGGVVTPDPSGSATTPTAPASPAPMLVVVDTNQVLDAKPGDGVGVFTEYSAGGKWRIWWTCD